MEEEAGVALLTRGARGVGPTRAGRDLLVRARLVTRQVALAREELRRAAGEGGGEVRAGLTPLLTLAALGPAFRRFRAAYPGVALHVIEGLVPRVLPLLRDGSLDFAIVAHGGDLPPGQFDAQHLATVGQVVVAREGHPAARSAAALAAQEWALPAPLVPGGALGAMFGRAGVAPPARLVVADALSTLALLRGSDVVSIVPERLLAEPVCAGIRAVSAPFEAPSLDLRLVSRTDAPLARPAASLARCLKDALRA